MQQIDQGGAELLQAYRRATCCFLQGLGPDQPQQGNSISATPWNPVHMQGRAHWGPGLSCKALLVRVEKGSVSVKSLRVVRAGILPSAQV